MDRAPTHRIRIFDCVVLEKIPLTTLFALILLLSTTIAGSADNGAKTRAYLEGKFTFEVIGPGAAPYGITSGLLGSLGIGVNLGRLSQMQLPTNPGLDADEHTRIDLDFTLIPESKGRWELYEYTVHHTAEDFTTLQEGDIRIADSMTSSDQARFSEGRWVVAPEGIPKDFQPTIGLKLWRAKTARACEDGPGWLPTFLAGQGEVLCYELELNLIYPVAPVGTSAWTKGDEFGIRLRARNGIYSFSMEAPEVPDISDLLPDREQSVAAMETLAEFFSELVGKATGSQPQQPSIDPSQVQDVRKNVKDLLRGVEAMQDQFDQLQLDLRSGHNLQRTWRGAVENGLIKIDDVYPILSGGQATDLGRLPVLHPVLEKVDDDWLPEDGNSVEVRARFEGAATEPMDWRFELMEVTTEKGKCLNSPDRDTTPDLFFDDAANAALGFTAAQQVGEKWRVETTRPLEVATLRVASRDFGAWGKLKAWVKMGRDWQPVAIEASDLDYITIPLDESGGENFIADSWERDEGLSPGQSHRLDDDAKGPDNSHLGDGLSLYEEYRGVFVKGDHVRTRPTNKDLFLHFKRGDGLDGYGRYFHEAAGTEVHEVSWKELFGPGQDMVINRNSSPDKRTAPGHQQRGKFVRIMPEDRMRGGVCGLAAIGGHTVNLADMPACTGDETFVHELMHSLSVKHHGWDWRPESFEVCVGEGRNPDGGLNYFPDCEKHPGLPTKVTIAYWDSPFSGDQWCFMVYQGAAGFTESRNRPTPVLSADGALRKFQDASYTQRICRSQEGTEHNANGEQVNGASREYGNCWEQIRIRDEE
ncbi:MAG: hypothetical protein ACC742_12475 [Thermoanaerobaculales bacterium]